MEKKAVWMRLGVTVILSEKQISVIKSGGPAAKGLIQDLFNIGKFELNRETFVPSCPAGEHEWSVEKDMKFNF